MEENTSFQLNFWNHLPIFLFWLSIRLGGRTAVDHILWWPYHPQPSRQESHLLFHLALHSCSPHTHHQEYQTVFICTEWRRRVRSVSKFSVGPLYSHRPGKDNTLLTAWGVKIQIKLEQSKADWYFTTLFFQNRHRLTTKRFWKLEFITIAPSLGFT